MEEFGFIYTVTILFAIIIIFILEYLEVKGVVKKNISKYIFGMILLISILLVIIGLAVGQYKGLGISMIGVYLLVPSICALLVDVVLKKIRKKKV